MAVDDGYREDRTRAYPLHAFVRGDSYSFLGLRETNLHFFGVDDPGKFCFSGPTPSVATNSRAFCSAARFPSPQESSQPQLLSRRQHRRSNRRLLRWLDRRDAHGNDRTVPRFAVALLPVGVRAFLPLHVSPARTFLLLTCVIGLIGWARPARLVRGVVLSARTRNYVSAARGFGGSDFYLLRRHILPETFGVILTQSALLVPRYIAAEVALSFFGLGVNEPVPSWGNMLSALQQYSVLISYGWLLAPAAALFVTSVTYYLLADALHSRLESR